MPSQIVVVPEIVPGTAGIVFTVTTKVCTDEEPQALFAFTEIVPLVGSAVVEIELVVEVPLQPDGSVHVYELAEGSFVTEYILLLPEQIVVDPKMIPGVAGGVFTVTAKVCAEEDPQELFAMTEIVPLEASAVVEIELVVEVPLQPPGKVQV